MNAERKFFGFFAFSCLAAGSFLPCWAGCIDILSPSEGSEQVLLKPLHKEFLSLDRNALKEWELDAAKREQMHRIGSAPQGVVVRWVHRRTDGESDPKRWALTVRRKDDGALFEHCILPGSTNEFELSNLEIATRYSLRIAEYDPKNGETNSVETTFSTEDIPPRLLRVHAVHNVRDLGGWVGEGGKRIRQGLIFRSQGFNYNAYYRDPMTRITLPKEEWGIGRARGTPESRRECLRQLGIRTEIDLRRVENELWRITGSPLGRSVEYLQIPGGHYVQLGDSMYKAAFAKAFRIFTRRENYPISFHCIAGADRTGSLAYVLGSLLGMSEEDLDRDYHFTVFSDVFPWPYVKDCCRLDGLKKVFSAYPGKDIHERILAYVHDTGVRDEEILAFKEIMFGKDVSAGDVGVYEKFVRSTSRERRGFMLDAEFRKRMKDVGTPPDNGVCAVPRWYGITGNMRDLGGWRAEGKGRIRYGRLFRSAFFGDRSDAQESELKRLGIRTDLDLREPGAPGMGSGVETVNLSAPAYQKVFDSKGRVWFRKAFDLLLDKSRYPIAFHCAKGADRTGTLAALLELLLGVDEDDVAKDWELTAFFNPNPLFENSRYDGLMAGLSKYPGDTWQKKAEAFARDCGITSAELDSFRSWMIEYPSVEFGLLSDAHIVSAGAAKGKEGWNGGCKTAFEWFAKEGVDAVVNAGDVTEDGSVEEVDLYCTIFSNAFPNGFCRNDRQKVSHMSVWGNHDCLDSSRLRGRDLENQAFWSIPSNSTSCALKLDGVARMEGLFVREVHGSIFAGADWKLDKLGARIIQEAGIAAHGRPFFYIQHALSGTPEMEAVLDKYRNCIRISGHSHIPVDDPRSLRVFNNRLILLGGSTSSLSHLEGGFGIGRFGVKEIHAAIIRVWSDRLTISRRELFYDEPLGYEVECRWRGDADSGIEFSSP